MCRCHGGRRGRRFGGLVDFRHAHASSRRFSRRRRAQSRRRGVRGRSSDRVADVGGSGSCLSAARRRALTTVDGVRSRCRIRRRLDLRAGRRRRGRVRRRRRRRDWSSQVILLATATRPARHARDESSQTTSRLFRSDRLVLRRRVFKRSAWVGGVRRSRKRGRLGGEEGDQVVVDLPLTRQVPLFVFRLERPYPRARTRFAVVTVDHVARRSVDC